jgi:hypothetical protein
LIRLFAPAVPVRFTVLAASGLFAPLFFSLPSLPARAFPVALLPVHCLGSDPT